MAGMETFRDLRRLHRKVDGFFARVASRHPEMVKCAEGCTDCCTCCLTLLPVEHAYLRVGARPLRGESLARLQKNIKKARENEDACPLLFEERCLLYEFRPIICRTQGLVWTAWEEGAPVRGVCPKNFTGVAIEQLPEEFVLNLDTLNTLLYSVNSVYCKNQGLKEDRISILTILED